MQAVSQSDKPCSGCLHIRHMLVKRIKPRISSIHQSTPLTKVKDCAVLAEEVLLLRKQQKDLEAELCAIKKAIEHNSVEVSPDLHSDLKQFYIAGIENLDPFVRLFWEEQEKAFRRKNRGMRWHPMLIKFAIFIRQQSPAVYRCLRDIGVIKLPGESTLQDYTTIFSAAPGFQKQVLEDLRKEVEGFDDSHRYVCLLHDEMSIKCDLVFDRKSDKLLGYVAPEQFDPQKVCL